LKSDVKLVFNARFQSAINLFTGSKHVKSLDGHKLFTQYLHVSRDLPATHLC